MYDDNRPLELRDPDVYATFLNELQSAAACCKVVQGTIPDSESPGDVLLRARREGATSVTAVSRLSVANSTCSQQFQVFEASGYTSTTYFIAFRADAGDLVKEKTSTSRASPGSSGTPSGSVENGQWFDSARDGQVDQALWRRAASIPLRSLPPQWLTGLREGRDRLILTGYSIGGAVAALATLQLLENDEHSSMRNQGGRSYADRINSTFLSHFYHAVYEADPIPGILTLVNKVAKDIKPTSLYINVVTDICALAGIAVGVAVTVLAPPAGVPTAAALAAVLLPGAGNAERLLSNIRKLIKSNVKSSLPLPEYKFGGTLLRMDSDLVKNITFGYIHGCLNEFLEKVFRVERHDDFIAHSLQNSGRPSIERYIQIIKGVHDRARSVSRFANSDRQLARVSTSNAHIVQHNVGCIPLNFGHSSQGGRASDHDAGSPGGTDGDRFDDFQQFKKIPWLLEPKFRHDKTISVCLDQNERNITIEVNGENIVLGLHVLYQSKDGTEKLWVPCTDNYRPNFMDAHDDLQQSMLSSNRFPLRFSTDLRYSILSFDDGSFTVELAFGSKIVPANSLKIRKFNPMEEIGVAERFASMPPQELINLLITSAKVTAQARCHAAFNAIQKNASAANEIVKETLAEVGHKAPSECDLLDHFLALMDTSQLPYDVLKELPEKMQEALNFATKSEEGNLEPLFRPADKCHRSTYWTFSKCFERAAQPILTKEMLSKKGTAQELGRNLDIALFGPKMVLNAFLDSKLEVRGYAKAFSYESLRSWEKEKRIVSTAGEVMAKIGGSVPLVSAPIWILGDYVDDPTIKRLARCVGGAIGAPTALVGFGLFYSMWFLSHLALTPMRMMLNAPGLVNDLRLKFLSSKARLDDWDTKLQAACILYELKSQPPHIACQMEFDLHKMLKDRVGEGGCFDITGSDLPFASSRHELLPTLQVANYGSAGRWMHEVRQYLTGLRRTVGLIGTSQAGKSCFAQHAFQVESPFGPGLEDRTRVMRRWSVRFGVNDQFALIDFPGSTDQADPDLYIRGLSLASLLVVIVRMTEFVSTQTVALILEVCKAIRRDKKVSALFCFTHADPIYKEYREVAKSRQGTTARQLFTDNLMAYKTHLINLLNERGSTGPELEYVSSNIHACSFAPKLQAGTRPLAQELQHAGVKNVAWVKNWCLAKLSNIS